MVESVRGNLRLIRKDCSHGYRHSRNELFAFSKSQGLWPTSKAWRISNRNTFPKRCNTARSIATFGCRERKSMKLSRRLFFSALLLAKPAGVTSLKVEVLETFDIDRGSVAILVHHADAASRQNFATWLQNN